MKLADMKLLADIAKITSEIYGLLVDKSRTLVDKDAKIAALEKELSALKAKR